MEINKTTEDLNNYFNEINEIAKKYNIESRLDCCKWER